MGQIWLQILALPQGARASSEPGQGQGRGKSTEHPPKSSSALPKGTNSSKIWRLVPHLKRCGHEPPLLGVPAAAMKSQLREESGFPGEKGGPEVPRSSSHLPEVVLSHSTSAGQMLLPMSSDIWPVRVFRIYHQLVTFTAKLLILEIKPGFRRKKNNPQVPPTLGLSGPTTSHLFPSGWKNF